MTKPTAEQLAEAKRLIVAIEAKRHQVTNLKALITAAGFSVAANEDERCAAVNFDLEPNKLAGAMELFRRTDPTTRQAIPQSYYFLLSAMLESLVPGGRPKKVDFDHLHPGARPYLLGPYLNLTVGKTFPRLCFERSNPQRGRLTYVVTGGPVDVQLWRQHLPAVNEWFDGDWSIEKHTATTISLIRRKPLPDIIPFNPKWLRDGDLFLGIDVETRKPFYVPINEMTHTLVCGTTGMGKSNGLHVLLRSFLHNIDQFDHVHLVCGKGGVAFRRYTGIHPKVSTYSEPEDLWHLAADLVRTMKARNAKMVERGEDNTYSGYIALVIDEFGAFNLCDNPDRKSDEFKSHQAFMTAMMHLGKRGRSAGIRLILTTQEPTERDISTGIKSVLPSALAYRLPLTQHATSVFGELSELPDDVRRMQLGLALYADSISAELAVIKFPILCSEQTTDDP